MAYPFREDIAGLAQPDDIFDRSHNSKKDAFQSGTQKWNSSLSGFRTPVPAPARVVHSNGQTRRLKQETCTDRSVCQTNNLKDGCNMGPLIIIRVEDPRMIERYLYRLLNIVSGNSCMRLVKIGIMH